MHWEAGTYLDSEIHWKRKKIKQSLCIIAHDASAEVRSQMNLEKGIKFDAWNEVNEAFRSETEVVRSRQLKKLGLRTLGPRPKKHQITLS